MSNKDRFGDLPPTPFEEWQSRHRLRGTMRHASSYAYLSRMLYISGGVGKSDLVGVWAETVKHHERKLASLRAGKGDPDDTIEQRERELQESREALEEVNGLPDDSHAKNAS